MCASGMGLDAVGLRLVAPIGIEPLPHAVASLQPPALSASQEHDGAGRVRMGRWARGEARATVRGVASRAGLGSDARTWFWRLPRVRPAAWLRRAGVCLGSGLGRWLGPATVAAAYCGHAY